MKVAHLGMVTLELSCPEHELSQKLLQAGLRLLVCEVPAASKKSAAYTYHDLWLVEGRVPAASKRSAALLRGSPETDFGGRYDKREAQSRKNIGGARVAEEHEKRKMYPSDLTDAQWAILEPLLPAPRYNRGGRPAGTRDARGPQYALVSEP